MTHTPQHPAGQPGDHSFIDLVPGDPPVGHTVWRTPTGGDASPVPQRLAYRLLAAFTTPGDTIVDLTGSPTIAACAAAGGRTHVRAAFDRTRRIIVVATTPPPARRSQAMAPGQRGGEPPEITDWFGDDLRDPDRPAGTVDGRTRRPGPAAAAPTLLIAVWPLHTSEPANTDRLTDLMAAAASVLAAGRLRGVHRRRTAAAANTPRSPTPRTSRGCATSSTSSRSAPMPARKGSPTT